MENDEPEMFSAPEVSIIVPTFRQGAYIGECLDTLLAQTYTNFEVIIQDAYSPDQTKQECQRRQEKDPRIHFFQEKDGGQSDAINRGIAKARGKYWTWICSDDYWHNPKALELMLKELSQDRDEKYAGVFGRAQYVSEEGSFLSNYACVERDVDRDLFLDNWPLCQPASLLRLSLTRAIGGVNAKLNLGMDLDLFVRLLERGRKMLFVPVDIASVRVQPMSKSVLQQRQTGLTAIHVLKKNFPDYSISLNSKYLYQVIQSFIPACIFPMKSSRSRLLHHYWDCLEEGKNAWRYKVLFFFYRDKVALSFDFLMKAFFKISIETTMWLGLLRDKRGL